MSFPCRYDGSRVALGLLCALLARTVFLPQTAWQPAARESRCFLKRPFQADPRSSNLKTERRLTSRKWTNVCNLKVDVDLLDQRQVLESTGRTRLPTPIRVRDVCLTGTVCLRNSVGQWQDRHSELPDRLPPEWPPLSRHTSCTPAEP